MNNWCGKLEDWCSPDPDCEDCRHCYKYINMIREHCEEEMEREDYCYG